MGAQRALVFTLTILTIFGSARSQDACNTASGFTPSPTSCSSYFYCDFLGRVQEAECEEGRVWNQDLESCDEATNVRCIAKSDPLRFLKEGPGILKLGLQLASLAGRVGTNLVGLATGSDPSEEKEVDVPILKARFGAEEQQTLPEIETPEIELSNPYKGKWM